MRHPCGHASVAETVAQASAPQRAPSASSFPRLASATARLAGACKGGGRGVSPTLPKALPQKAVQHPPVPSTFVNIVAVMGQPLTSRPLAIERTAS